MRLARPIGIHELLLAGLIVLLLLLIFFTPKIAYGAPSQAFIDCKEKIPTPANCLSYDPAVNPILKIESAKVDCNVNKPANASGLCPTEEPGYGTCQDYRLGDGLVGGGGSYAFFCVDSAKKYTWLVDNVAVGTFTASDSLGPITADTKEENAEAEREVISQPEAALKGLGNCSLINGDLGTCLLSIMGNIIAIIEHVILMVAAAILGFANYLLGWTIYLTIFRFGTLFGNSGGLHAAWGVVRDVGNILLLFGFIFMGVATILNLPNSEFTAKRALPMLIIFALLMNFSLLVTEGVIDVANAFATSIHDQIAGGEVCTSETGTLDCALDKGIGGRLMQMSGVAGIWDFKNIAGSDDGIRTAVIYAGLIVFVVIATLVLIAAAVMLIIRALVLAFLMVTSPIGFAGMAVPPLQEIARKWWDELICQATFAPVYFVLVLISFKIMEGVMTALGTAPGSEDGVSRNTLAAIYGGSEAAGQVSNITIGITFALIIGFMIASLMFAKKSSCLGSGVAIKAGGSFAFGSLGWVGRNTAGRGLYQVGRALQSTKFGSGNRYGIALTSGLNRIGKASFDARATKPVSSGLTSLSGNLGTPNKGGYAGKVHEQEEKRKKYAEGLGRTDNEQERIIEIQGLDGKGGLLKEAADKYEKTKADNDAALEKAKADSDIVHAGDIALVNKRQGELDDANKRIAEFKKKAERAFQSGDTAGAKDAITKLEKAENDAETAQTNLESAQRDYDSRTEASLAAITSKIERDNMEYERVANKLKGELGTLKGAGDRRKEAYAREIEHPSILGKTVGRITGVGNTASHHAATAILKDLSKSPDEKNVDRLIKALKSESGAGTESHTAPAAPGGGSTH